MTGRKKANLGDLKTDAAADSASEHEAETLTKQKRRQSGKSLSPPYIPTDREREALIRQYERQKAEPPVPRLKVDNVDGVLMVLPDHPNQGVGLDLLQEAIGTGSREFLGTILMLLRRACSCDDTIDQVQLDHMFSVVLGIRPRDQIEVMLAIKMAAIHWLMMSFLERVMRGPSLMQQELEQQEIIDRIVNRQARTYAMLMETLKRYRTGGEQKVTVHHVSVNEGGQAIVGNVTQRVRGSVPQKSADRPPALTDLRQEPMPIIEERQHEPEPVPARRKRKDNGQSSS